MTAHCDDLDGFFDGELSTGEAAAFREHLAACERCQAALLGRAQEEIVVRMAHEHVQQPRTTPDTTTLVHGPAHRRRVVMLAPILAAAALVVWLVVTPKRDQPGPVELSYARGKRDTVARATDPHPGDVVRLVARGGRHRALWLYLGDRELVFACPGSAQCVLTDDEIALEIAVTAPGLYTAIALAADQPIIVPQGPLDARLAAATSMGVHFKMKPIDVH